MPNSDLFILSRRLHEVNDLEAVMVEARRAISQRTPYQQVWMMLVAPGGVELEAIGFPNPQDPELLQRIVEHQSEPNAATRITALGSTTESSRSTKRYDDSPYVRMLFNAQEPIVVPDQRKHPLADQEEVAFYGNRTLIWVPLAHLSARQGIMGVGTFAAQGVVEPTAGQLDFIVQVAALVALVSQRIAVQDENQLLQAKLASKERLESLGRLAGEVSHDLCNILMCILGNIEFIEESVNEEHAALEYVRDLYEATTRATGLSRQLLTFSAGGVGQQSTVDIAETLTGLTVMLQRLLPKPVELELDLSPGLFVHVDPGQLEQLVMNLVLNSRDAMPSGGHIRVATSIRKLPKEQTAQLGVAHHESHVHLTVADDGTGMSESVLQKIFEPFYTTKELGKGTGLGMSVVDRVTRQFGGFANVQSESNVGTTVHIYLPLQREPDLDSVQDSVQDSAALREKHLKGSGQHVLVVDDDPSIRRVLQRQLCQSGYRVTMAEHGKEALRILSECTDVEIVVSDLVMPVMGGEQLVAAITAGDDPIPCVVMTGHGVEQLTHSHILAKPFAANELLLKLHGALAS